MKAPYPPNVREKPGPNGKTIYFLDYWDPFQEKRIRQTIGKRKDHAVKKSAAIYEDLMAKFRGEEPIEEITEQTLTGLKDTFLRGKQLRRRPATYRRYKACVENFLAFLQENFPDTQNASAVSKAMVEEFLERQTERGRSTATTNNELRTIKSMFKFAVEEGWIRSNPAQNVVRLLEPNEARRVKYWSKGEVQAILAAVKPYYRDAFEFLYQTGLRREELTHLTWSDVLNPDTAEPSIAIQASPEKGDWKPKTGERRIVPLSTKAIEILRRQTHSELHPFVFHSKTGRVLRGNKLRDELARALEKLELKGNVHQFRHTFASHLVSEGVTLQVVGDLLGHKDPKTTLIYAHLSPDYLRSAVQKLA